MPIHLLTVFALFDHELFRPGLGTVAMRLGGHLNDNLVLGLSLKHMGEHAVFVRRSHGTAIHAHLRAFHGLFIDRNLQIYAHLNTHSLLNSLFR